MARGTALTRACAAEKLPPAAAHRPLTVHRLPAADGPALLPAAWTRTPPASTQPAPTPPAPTSTEVSSPQPDPGPADIPSGPGDRADTGPERPAANWQSRPSDDERVGAIARSVAQASLEVLGGTRPLQQMSRWLDSASYERLQLRANLVRSRQLTSGPDSPANGSTRLYRSVRIRSCRVCPVAEGIYETSVVAVDATRVRAVALRLELRRGLWKVTALQIG